MNGFFTQIILGAQDPDSNDLINILFVVVIGIVYAIGGFIKAKARKAGQQEEEPQEPAKAKPAGAGRQIYRQLSRPEPVELELSYRKPQDLRAGRGKGVHKLEEQLKRLKMPIEIPKEDFSAKPPETVEPEPRIKSFLNLESSDDLKKAFLYYEVLGKPVGFRG